MPRFVRAACLLLTLACSSTAATAADFIIDPAQSYLTLTGGYDDSGGIPVPKYWNFDEQSLGSLTTHFSGKLLVDNFSPTGGLRFAGNAIKPLPLPNNPLPYGTPADSAWQITDFFGAAQHAYFAVREQYLSIQGDVQPTPVQGELRGPRYVLLNSDQVQIDAGPFGLANEEWGYYEEYEENRLVHLDVVGDALQLTIPVDFATKQSAGINFDLHYTGQIVAHLPLSEAPSPEVIRGGFEGTLVQPGQTDSTGLNTGRLNPATSSALQPTEGLHVGYLDVTNGTSTLTQTIANARWLTPDDMFEVSFDIGNFEMLTGDTLGDDVDDLISVQAYFAKSNAPLTPLGETFSLPQLSAIEEGTWWLDQRVLFDASLLGPDQFTGSLQFVIQATSTSGTTGRLVVDDIQLRRVPEPATWILGLIGAAALVIFRRRTLVKGIESDQNYWHCRCGPGALLCASNTGGVSQLRSYPAERTGCVPRNHV
jgi:hypothetical protein